MLDLWSRVQYRTDSHLEFNISNFKHIQCVEQCFAFHIAGYVYMYIYI